MNHQTPQRGNRIEVGRLGEVPNLFKSEVDKDGYFVVCVGALNAHNSRGEYYVADQAKDLVEKNSVLSDRAKRGVLRSEYGHPKWEPHWTEQEFIYRLKHYDEDRICGTMYGLYFDEDYTDVKNIGDGHNRVLPILAKLRPTGPLGNSLEKDLLDPHMNVAFSVRSTVDAHRVNNKWYKKITNLLAFDQVVDGGISIANQGDCPRNVSVPSMESISLPLQCTGDSCPTDLKDKTNLVPMFSLESLNIMVEDYTHRRIPEDDVPKPIYYNWK